MVVVCESCSTRFRIDDDRIPARGRLVRCSQCKATFVARPNDATVEETIEDVVAEVTQAGGAPVPEVATDLFDRSGDDLGGTSARPAGAAPEERWEFEDESAGEIHGATALPAVESLGCDGQAVGDDPVRAESVDPVEWDLLRGSVEEEASEAKFTEPAVEPAAQDGEAFLRRSSDEEAPAAPRRRSRPRLPGTALLRAGMRTGAWLALGLLAWVAVEPLWHGVATRPSAVAPRSFVLADGSEAREVRGTLVENAFEPALFVVQGELARSHADPLLGLRVAYSDAQGERVGEGVWAGVAPSASALRERTPEALVSQTEASAAAAARGGRFAAVLPLPPESVTGFTLALEPLPFAPSPEPAQETPDATASSPPASLPASE